MQMVDDLFGYFISAEFLFLVLSVSEINGL